MHSTKWIGVGLVVVGVAMVGIMSCNRSEREARNPAAPATAGGGGRDRPE